MSEFDDAPDVPCFSGRAAGIVDGHHRAGRPLTPVANTCRSEIKVHIKWTHAHQWVIEPAGKGQSGAMLLRDHLLRGSSPIDWCEDNYVYNPFIAEFFNTVSNLPFLLIPPFLMHLHKVYGESIGRGIHCIWALLIIIGICSAYFHATLSLLGQLLDELAILWVVMAGIALWYPRAAIPISLRDKHGRKTFSTLVCSSPFPGHQYP